MALTRTSDSATIGTTEYSLVSDSTSLATDTNAGLYSFSIGFENMVAGDQYEVRLYEKAWASGTKRLVCTPWVKTGISEDLHLPAIVLGHGWDITVKRTAGSDRTIGWTINKVT